MSVVEAHNAGKPPLRQQTFGGSLRINLRVLGALMMREASARYGHENMGFFWLMIEPLTLALGVMVMWSLTGRGEGHGVGLVPFVLSGYSVLTMWRHIVALSVHGLRRNADLLFHRNVRAFDILFAVVILEMAGILAAFFIAYVPLVLIGAMEPMRDPLLLLGAWILMAWFAFGFGLLITSLTEISEVAEHFVQPIMYLTLPVTGAFTMQVWLPGKARQFLSWSPLVNVQEMFRGGLFPADVQTEWDATYLLLCCVVLTAIGLPLVRFAQRHVRMG
ncbi:MAG TPA: ABC transporter permease [Methylocella sp.]|nr:ABC transporter permease [Methylocella sp.]